MAAFYQKYRPQRFAEVVGQEAIVQTLKNAAKSGGLAHAYLLTGSRGVGKTTLARLIAKAANCQNLKDGDPCGKCEICTAIAAGNSLDIVEIDAASHTGVDNVREVIEHASFRPSTMQRKVFIIDEVHMLSKAAFNALLKTLEEPPEHAMFILATTDIEKVPDTIVSRAQRFDFKRISPEQMLAALESIAKDQKLKLPNEVLIAVVEQSEGSMRDALTRLDMVASLGSKVSLDEAQQLLGVTPIAKVQELVNLMINHEAAALPDYFTEVFSKGTDPAVFNRGVLAYLRALLAAKLTGQSGHFQSNNEEDFQQQLSAMSLPQLMFLIRLFLRSYKELNTSPSPDLPLLLAAVEASLYGQAQQMKEAVQTAASEQPAQSETAQPSSTSRVEIGTSPATSNSIHTEQTLEDLLTWWPQVIAYIKTENSPVATLLKNCPVTAVDNGRIIVGVKYLFHKEHLDNKKHAALILEAIETVSGRKLLFRAEIQKHPEATAVNTMDAISDALKVFGGELVE